MTSCPNCHQPVSPSDDICENCGAVLSTISIPAFVAATPATTSPSPPASTTSSPVASPIQCPNCHAPLHPGDDICEQCGMVVSSAVALPPLTGSPATSASSPDECPRCHHRRTTNSRFCNGCGYSFSGIPAAASSKAPATSAPPLKSEPTPVSALKIGSILNNKYKIVKEIGAGGMGAVYLADDTVLKRQVVIKALLSDDDPDLVEQSVKEREFLAAIKHASIVSIYDFLTMGQQGYIVMEYVHGKTLDQLMEERGRPFNVPEAIRYILGILPAFSYLARLRMVYCDFKPQNVMVETLKDGSQVVKLVDLGTVIKYEPHPKDVYGTHGFYAPEAVKSPSPETDLYSICRTLAYMVSQMDLANPIFGMPSIESYQAFRDHPALYRLLAKGTHTRPGQRFRSAEELQDQLTGVLLQIEGGKPGVPVGSKLFVPGILTTTGKLGLHGEAVLDETDRAIDQLRYGDQSLRSGNYQSARSFYQNALKSNPKSIDAHLRLAEVYIDTGEYTKALSEVTLAQRVAPSSWKIAWYTGRLLEAQGKYADAAEQYRELIADLPGELSPQQALARVYARIGDHTNAVDLYTNVIKADPGNTDAILGVTRSLIDLQRWNEAASVLNSVNESAARYVEAQMLLCDLYLTHMAPLTTQNVEMAASAIHSLDGRTEDARYFLMSGDVYRAAWQLARQRKLSSGSKLAGVANNQPTTLRAAAEKSYIEYLRRDRKASNREDIVRRKLEVAPWRLF
ncbi:MAG: tetratricopeptide repeat protein [Ktedonobacteraceae bacterium]|nr:tetratricopeptide repeat protein [Ktedonobacteraceae bacterium]